VAVRLVNPFTNSRGGSGSRVRANVVGTASLHNAGEGRAGKSQESQGVDHFEELKVFLVLDNKKIERFKRVKILKRDEGRNCEDRVARLQFICTFGGNDLT
jgi:hypothetical protein